MNTRGRGKIKTPRLPSDRLTHLVAPKVTPKRPIQKLIQNKKLVK